jgi:hypothetical protein
MLYRVNNLNENRDKIFVCTFNVKRLSISGCQCPDIQYKAILKPIWTYGIELWGCAKPSNTIIFQAFQSKTLRCMTGAPWYMSTSTIHDDLNVPYITDEIKKRAN